jgi:hypothetical protein
MLFLSFDQIVPHPRAHRARGAAAAPQADKPSLRRWVCACSRDYHLAAGITGVSMNDPGVKSTYCWLNSTGSAFRPWTVRGG